MSELKPCPFCGGEAELCYSEVDIFCRKCNVMQETEMWNTRPIEDALRKRIAELEEQVWNLNLENERLEEAYWIDETISPDGTLKPSVRKLLERLEKAETDLRLSDDLVKALDNRIAKLEAENDQLAAHDATERQDDKSSNDTQTQTFVYGKDVSRSVK